MSKEERMKLLKEQKEITDQQVDIEVAELINDKITPTNKRGKYTRNQVYEMIDSGEYRVLANKIYRVAAAGALRKTIRGKLGITTSLWQDMMNLPDSVFPKNKNLYKQALVKGEIDGCYVVADALKETALGFNYVEENEKRDKEGNMVIVSRFKKYQPGNVKAQIHYLSRKLPDEWGIIDGTIINNDNRQININDIQNMPKELRSELVKFVESQKNLPNKDEVEGEIIDVK